MIQKSYDSKPTLFLIATPIGNMDDISYRAIETLKNVSVIFAEDTRITNQLLKNFNIKNKLIASHQYNEKENIEKLLSYLNNKENVGLVTDRGTPIISDPGYKTVKYISDKGYNVVALPGANAFVPALIVSGISPQPFIFYGFLDSKDSKKKKELDKLKYSKETMIFYEAPHRIIKTLKLMLDIFGDRDISVSREISKKFESIYRGKISDLILNFDNVKGEFVIIVSGYVDNNIDYDISISDSINFYINEGLSKNDAIKMVAHMRKMKKSDVYSIYHKESK